MADPKPAKKGKKTPKPAFEAQADSFLEGLQIVPGEAKETAPKQAGAPATVSKLIDFIKKM